MRVEIHPKRVLCEFYRCVSYPCSTRVSVGTYAQVARLLASVQVSHETKGGSPVSYIIIKGQSARFFGGTSEWLCARALTR